MQNKQKHYVTNVRSDGDGDLPSQVEFSIDEDTARNIVFWSALIRREDLHKIERFDYRATYRKSATADWEEEGEDEDGEDGNTVRTDCDCLNVTGTEFWFSALLKHTDVDVRSERQSIAELAAFFDLPTDIEWKEAAGTTPQAESAARLYVQRVASLFIWDYDRDNGQPYAECQEPDDGYLDSHNALMGLVEDARKVLDNAGNMATTGQAITPNAMPITERDICAELLDAKFAVLCIGDSEVVASCIRHGVLAEEVLRKLPADTCITAEKFYDYGMFGEALVWLSPHFEFANWQDRPLAEALAAFPQITADGPNNALSFPSAKPNRDGVKESYLSLAQLREATPDGHCQWCLPNGLILKIKPMAAAIQS